MLCCCLDICPSLLMRYALLLLSSFFRYPPQCGDTYPSVNCKEIHMARLEWGRGRAGVPLHLMTA